MEEFQTDSSLLRTVLAGLLELIAGGGGLFLPRGEYAGRRPRRALVLEPGAIPTTDLYLKGRLEGLFGEVRYVDTLRTAPAGMVSEDLFVVVVRHAPPKWLRWLEGERKRVAGIAFLMDDDIPAAAKTPELPFRYAMKTAWRYALARRRLGTLCSEVWLSTPELVRRYGRSSPRLWEPAYVGPEAAGEAQAVYFYHGTWAHRREIEWLVPVVRRVQDAVPGAWFEIMGTGRVRRLFRGIPRVRVVHPMAWPDYLAYSRSVRFQVGLAPCFDTPFNRARSHSKMFDITRLGSAGIYSNVPPYAGKVVDGETGVLCENEPESWVSAIRGLLQDENRRMSIHAAASRELQASASRLLKGFP